MYSNHNFYINKWFKIQNPYVHTTKHSCPKLRTYKTITDIFHWVLKHINITYISLYKKKMYHYYYLYQQLKMFFMLVYFLNNI